MHVRLSPRVVSACPAVGTSHVVFGVGENRVERKASMTPSSQMGTLRPGVLRNAPKRAGPGDRRADYPFVELVLLHTCNVTPGGSLCLCAKGTVALPPPHPCCPAECGNQDMALRTCRAPPLLSRSAHSF